MKEHREIGALIFLNESVMMWLIVKTKNIH